MPSASQKNLPVRFGALLVAFFFLFNSAFASGLLSSSSAKKHSEFVFSKKSGSNAKSPFQFPVEDSETEKETDDEDEFSAHKASRTSFLHATYTGAFLLFSLRSESSVCVNRNHVQFAGHVPLFLAKRVLLI